MADWRRLAMERIEQRADETALINGSSQFRSLDELRFHAGVVAGLREAADLLETLIADTTDEEQV